MGRPLIARPLLFMIVQRPFLRGNGELGVLRSFDKIVDAGSYTPILGHEGIIDMINVGRIARIYNFHRLYDERKREVTEGHHMSNSSNPSGWQPTFSISLLSANLHLVVCSMHSAVERKTLRVLALTHFDVRKQ